MKKTMEVLENLTKQQKVKFNKYGYATLAITPEAYKALSHALEVLKRVKDPMGILKIINEHVILNEFNEVVRKNTAAYMISKWLDEGKK